MIDGSFALLPFYDDKAGGGYLYACLVGRGSEGMFYGALGSQTFIFEHKIKRAEADIYIHSIGEQIVLYLDSLPNSPYIYTCWDLSQLASILIQCYLDRGFATSASWSPKEHEISYIEDEETLFLAVNYGNKKLIRFYSLKLFATRSDWLSLAKKLFPREKIVEKNVQKWEAPTDEQVQSLFDEARFVYSISLDMSKKFAFDVKPAVISAGGLSMFKLKSEISQKSDNVLNLNMILTPPMLPEDRQKQYMIMNTIFTNNKAQSISYLRAEGEYSRISSVDLNSAYGSALCSDRLPFGIILDDRPEGDYLEIVFPDGIYEVKNNKIPIMTFGTSFALHHYRFGHDWHLGENAKNFILDGTMAFMKKEWRLIRQYYDVIGNEKITIKYVRTASNKFIKDFVSNLYDLSIKNPERKQYYKAQIVGLFGKFIQNTEYNSQIYYNDENGIRRRSILTENKKPPYSVLGWYVASLTRIKILEKMEKMDLNDVVYIDTDQIYFMNFDKYSNLFKISKKIGDWKIQFKNCEVNFFAKKKYQIIYENGNVETKCSGLPQREKKKLQFGDLDYGLEREIYEYERDKNTYILKPIRKTYIFDDQPITKKRIEGVYYDY